MINGTHFVNDRRAPTTIEGDEFLTQIFANIPGKVVLCRPNGSGFAQQFWKPGLCAILPPAPWYFCMSTVRGLADDGKVRRRNIDLECTACLVLDDVGTRLPPSVITLEPSWVLYTSTKLWNANTHSESPLGEPVDNYQVGFILNGGMESRSAARLLQQLKKTALGPLVLTAATQPYRIPGSVNYKHDPPCVAKLIHWLPERRYTPSEIAQRFAILPPRPPRRPSRRTQLHDDAGDPVWEQFRRRGWVMGEPSGDWWPVRCPWQDLHSDHSMDGSADSGVAYRPRMGGELALFKCFHSSCVERKWIDCFDELVHRVDPRKLHRRRR